MQHNLVITTDFSPATVDAANGAIVFTEQGDYALAAKFANGEFSLVPLVGKVRFKPQYFKVGEGHPPAARVLKTSINNWYAVATNFAFLDIGVWGAGTLVLDDDGRYLVVYGKAQGSLALMNLFDGTLTAIGSGNRMWGTPKWHLAMSTSGNEIATIEFDPSLENGAPANSKVI